VASEDETTTVDDDLDVVGGDDAVLDGPEDGEPQREPAPAAPRRALDGRTLAICALVALIAAVAAGLVTRAVTNGDDDGPESAATLTRAEEVPDVVLPRLGSDEELRLSDYRGQPLVVNFWGSWCEPCVDEMPAFQRVHQSLGDQVAFLGVNVNDSVGNALRMVEQTGVNYDLARDVDGALGRALDITTFPTTVLVLPDGTIVETVYREMSAERLCEKVNQSLLNQALEECG